MRRAILSFAILTTVLTVLVGCSRPTSAQPGSKSPSIAIRKSQEASPESTANAPTTNHSEAPAADQARLLEYGFGQQGENVWVTSLVQNSSKKVGQFVTVKFNLLDSNGRIVKSESQLEQFSAVGQRLALGTQVDLAKGTRVGKVETTVTVELYSDGSESFPRIKTGPVRLVKDDFGRPAARFLIINRNRESLRSPRIGVICHDAKNRIVGGGSHYPGLLPAAGKAVVEVSVIATGNPRSCSAYAAPGF